MKIDRDTKTKADKFFRKFEKRMLKKYRGEISFIQYLRFNSIAKKRKMSEIIFNINEGIYTRLARLNRRMSKKGLLEGVNGLKQRIELYLWLMKLKNYQKAEIVQYTKYDKDYRKPFKLTLPKKYAKKREKNIKRGNRI